MNQGTRKEMTTKNEAAEKLRATWDQEPPNERMDKMLRDALGIERLNTAEPFERLTKAAEMARRNLQGTTPCYCASSPHEAYCGELLHAVGKARAILDEVSRG